MSGAPDNLRSHGSLTDTPLAEVFAALMRKRYEGSLLLARGRERKRVVWQGGAPVLVDSNAPDERLVARLRQTGRISPDDAERVASRLRERGGREESALLALELVTPDEIVDWLKRLLRERMIDLFSWAEGDYALDPGARAGDQAAALRSDPLPLLQEGLAVHRAPARIRGALAKHLDRFVLSTASAASAAERLHDDPELAAFLQQLDGSRRLSELIEAMHSPVALAGVWVLDALGALRYRHSAPVLQGSREVTRDQIEIVMGDGEEHAAAPASGPAQTAAAPRADRDCDSDALRAEILAIHEALDERSYYELLGVAPDVSTAEIKSAYLRAAKRYHPDALARLGLLELRGQARAIFSRIARAQGVLGDPQRRRDYDDSLSGEGENLDAARIVQAEMLYRKGEILLRSGNFAGALEFLVPASEQVPDDPAYALALGWALFKKSPADLEAARAACERAVKLDDHVALAHYRLGLVLQALGEGDAAASALAEARRLDPKLARG